MHKFGGASLADAAAIGHATGVVLGHRPEPTVVVVSAIAGATDALLAIASHAERGERDVAGRLLRSLRARYLRAARAVGPRGAAGRGLLASVSAELDELAELAAGLRLLRDLTPRTSDFVVARGERLSARIVAAALEVVGVRARYVDATAVIRTDDHFGHASPDYARTD
ncbi:MAG TPA: hypothetical protein VFM14_01955, partial [Gemmatimonadales bacterium]|nr:hypothetical protein [Gemmatimonadales bacterium]